MPVTKSAIKKLRQDVKREILNDSLRRKVKDIVKNAKKGEKTLSEAFSVIDKAAKKRLIHLNKAARLKSSLSKQAEGTTVAATSTVKKTTKTVTKKKTATSSKKKA